MTIADIKSQLGISTLMLSEQEDQKTKTKTDWVAHWENERRIRVTMHKDVLAKIKAENPNSLALKVQQVEAQPEELDAEGKVLKPAVAEYVRYVVITPDVFATL